MTRSMLSVHAPVRICDVGGWTDTWFAGHGRVCSIAVNPGVQITITPHPDTLTICVADAAYVNLEILRKQHPLLAAALDEIPPPRTSGWRIHISADMPPGCATGTSAAVSVALLAALSHLHGETLTPYQAARTAHILETERLGMQSGIQDQMAAAYGGINEIIMNDYPDCQVQPCQVSPQTRAELNAQLQLWYLGRPHQSSQVHEEVIRRLETVAETQQLLQPLRDAAAAASAALVKGDLPRYGIALQQNTMAQHTLHPALLCADATALIAYAQRAGALGWKVNGAGGDGGSVCVLWPDSASANHHRTAIHHHIPTLQHIPIQICDTGIRYESEHEE